MGRNAGGSGGRSLGIGRGASQKVLGAIRSGQARPRYGENGIDAIARVTGLSIRQVSATTTLLELRGKIRQEPGSTFTV